jgi:hypothetical protein
MAPDRPPRSNADQSRLARADGGPAEPSERAGTDDGDDGIDRRRLIMYVLAIAFAVPLIVEGLTLAGFVNSFLGGPAGTPTHDAGTATPTPELVEGSDLLADTDRTERVTTVTLRSASDGWTLTVTVQVENGGDLPYELRLSEVRTDGGRRIEGSATSGRVTPGESATVTAQWALPSGDRPDTVAVTAVEYDDGEQVLVDRTVRVGRVPVQG